MDHAIRFTAQCTQQSYLWPARHEAGQAQSVLSADGRALSTERVLHPAGVAVLGVLPDGPHDDEDLRPDPRRQREQLVLPGDGRHPVDLHRGRPTEGHPGESVRGGRRVVSHGESQLRSGATTQHMGAESSCGTPHTSEPHGYDLAGSDGGVFVFPTGDSSGFLRLAAGLGVHVGDVVGIVPTTTTPATTWSVRTAGCSSSRPGTGRLLRLAARSRCSRRRRRGDWCRPTTTPATTWSVRTAGCRLPDGDSSGFYGSLPGLGVHVDDIVGLVGDTGGGGYLLVGRDGGVFIFGNARSSGLTVARDRCQCRRRGGYRRDERRARGSTWWGPTARCTPSGDAAPTDPSGRGRWRRHRESIVDGGRSGVLAIGSTVGCSPSGTVPPIWARFRPSASRSTTSWALCRPLISDPSIAPHLQRARTGSALGPGRRAAVALRRNRGSADSAPTALAPALSAGAVITR